jgi:hypothetical protein
MQTVTALYTVNGKMMPLIDLPSFCAPHCLRRSIWEKVGGDISTIKVLAFEYNK